MCSVFTFSCQMFGRVSVWWDILLSEISNFWMDLEYFPMGNLPKRSSRISCQEIFYFQLLLWVTFDMMNCQRQVSLAGFKAWGYFICFSKDQSCMWFLFCDFVLVLGHYGTGHLWVSNWEQIVFWDKVRIGLIPRTFYRINVLLTLKAAGMSC